MTIFLTAIWGPVLLAFGLGFFFSRSFYIHMYRELEKSPMALLTFGMFAMAAGLAQVHFHNVWNSTPEVIVSLLGWALLIKGVICLVWPGLAVRKGDWVVKSNFVSASGLISLLVGAYLTWIAYFV